MPIIAEHILITSILAINFSIQSTTGTKSRLTRIGILGTNMKKSDKKIENAIKLALTNVCEEALETVEGFQWITHTVNYKNFPSSLSILCMFDNPESLIAAKASKKDNHLKSWIEKELAGQNIIIRNINSVVSFDTEERIH